MFSQIVIQIGQLALLDMKQERASHVYGSGGHRLARKVAVVSTATSVMKVP
jgi:hypothetical protein